MNTYDILYNNINLPEEHFINREEICNIINSCYNQFNIDGANMFEVFYIYGFGGMGKTCLVKFLKKNFLKTISRKTIIHITFEIQENSQMLYSLIKLRKKFNHSCPIFDYALLYYWDLERIERLDDDFINLIKSDIVSAYIDLGVNFSPFNNQLPSFGELQKIINSLNRKIKNIRIREAIYKITEMEANEIYENLPVFLAADIKKYMQQHNTNYIFIFDSYQQSLPYSESEEWLLAFINELQRGLYIITSREKTNWNPETYRIQKYHLDIYPEKETRIFLQTVIPDSRADIIEAIIEASGNIPIYVSLAYDLYLKEKTITADNLIKKSKFRDRATLVRHFINHLKKEWQDTIIYIACIKLFNEQIFDFLIDDLNLLCPKLDFYEIVQVSLVKYTENSNDLYKLHDVFCSNAISILPAEKINKIFNSYLKYLSQRGIYETLLSQRLETSISLFLNVIDLCIEYSDQLHWDKHNSQNLIDLFLIIADTRIALPLPKASVSFTTQINDFLYFMDAILYEKVNTKETIFKLKKINNPQLFGKHIKSYNLILKYAEALNGDYVSFKNCLETMEGNYNESERGEWYYLKTSIYLSDYYMMEGRFINAYTLLDELKNSISLEIYNTDNYFLVERSLGHIYRFNYDFDSATEKYESLLKQYENNPLLKVYLLVNLCETKCFYTPEYVIEKFSEALKLVDRFHNLKNKGKLYYSRGIANTLLKRFPEALNDIDTSIQINQEDGYRSGELFAYQAKAFYEYGKNGFITSETTQTIDNIVAELKVYEFLKYPIQLINGTLTTMENINWLNFKNTKKNCEKFIKNLASNECVKESL